MKRKCFEISYNLAKPIFNVLKMNILYIGTLEFLEIKNI